MAQRDLVRNGSVELLLLLVTSRSGLWGLGLCDPKRGAVLWGERPAPKPCSEGIYPEHLLEEGELDGHALEFKPKKAI